MKTWLKILYPGLIYTILYLPLLVLVLYSFNSSKYSLLWHGFSFDWYRELFADDTLWNAFIHSIILGTIAAILATAIAVAASFYLFLQQKPHNTLFGLLLILIIIPDLVLGVALLIFFNFVQMPPGFISLIIAHITFCLPFAFITINTRMQTLDANIYSSALDLGANKTFAFTRILLPLLFTAILGSFLLCLTLSFDDVIISYFVAGPEFNILPLVIFSLVRTGITPELNALCSIIFLGSIFAVIIFHRLTGKNS